MDLHEHYFYLSDYANSDECDECEEFKKDCIYNKNGCIREEINENGESGENRK